MTYEKKYFHDFRQFMKYFIMISGVHKKICCVISVPKNDLDAIKGSLDW